jgi:hypothetical protein
MQTQIYVTPKVYWPADLINDGIEQPVGKQVIDRQSPLYHWLRECPTCNKRRCVCHDEIYPEPKVRIDNHDGEGM